MTEMLTVGLAIYANPTEIGAGPCSNDLINFEGGLLL
jgi:hypothetical protein